MTTRTLWPGAVLLLAFQPAALNAQAPPASPSSQKPAGTPQRTSLDGIVAVVNGDLILGSDVDAEQRFQAFQPLQTGTPETRAKLIDRLIDRDLILQQMRQQPQAPISDAQVDAELALLRKDIPGCAAYHCEMDAGWSKFAADHGFTVDEVRDRWRIHMEVLRFIEQRFRMGIRISQPEIDEYYKTKLVPAYEKNQVAVPAESAVGERIQEILLQQQVTGLLDDWLKALRAQGSVRMMDAEDAPR